MQFVILGPEHALSFAQSPPGFLRINAFNWSMYIACALRRRVISEESMYRLVSVRHAYFVMALRLYTDLHIAASLQ